MKSILPLFAVILFLAFFLSGGDLSFLASDGGQMPPSGPAVELVDPETTIIPRSSLQLRFLVTPTPTPQSGGGGTPGTTPPPIITCRPGRKVAVNLLLDTSATMQGIRIDKLRLAIKDFADFFKDDNDAVFGMQEIKDPFTMSFLSSFYGRLGGARVVVRLNIYPNTIRNTVTVAVDGLSATGATHLKDGFILAQQEIIAAKTRFSGYEWIVIFLSDGRPQGEDPLSPVPYPQQDPTSVANQMKGSTVDRIISIAMAPRTQQDENVMRNVAYSRNPSDQNFYLSPVERDADDLTFIWRSIGNSICR